ncbi:MAG: YeiH family protein [Eubacteriales bacterium]|nr:YeiH family protein [Eubacteriales bacterium]
MKAFGQKVPGILLAGIIAVPAWFIGSAVPVIGSPVLGILFGMLLAFWRRPETFNNGIRFTSRIVLQYSIILLGFGMNLYSVFSAGAQTLVLMAFTLTATFVTAYLAGRALRIDENTKILIGVGTAICGGSAIAATAPVIRASDEDVAQSISTIFLFNVIAAFLFPALGHLFGMTDQHFGIWAGTAINDTSSVVAAGYTFSAAAGDLAVIVKLTRTLMIIPVTLALALYETRKAGGTQKQEYHFSKIFPWFVLGFLLASILNTFVSLPSGLTGALTTAGKFMIVMAMAAIGLNTNIVNLLKKGGRPILMGLICWFVLSITSLIVQYTVLHL